MRDLDWLLSGESWIEYRTRVDLLHEAFDDEQTEHIATELSLNLGFL